MAGVKTGRVVTALTLAASLVTGLWTTEAKAGGGREDRSLTATPSAPREDAGGDVQAREKGRTRTLKVRVRNLEPKRDYEVVVDGEPVDTFRTNRKGRGKASLKDRAGDVKETSRTGDDGGDFGEEPKDPPAGDDNWSWSGDKDWYCIQILDVETGECVLACDDDGDRPDDPVDPIDYEYSMGFAEYTGAENLYGFVSMFHSAWGEETFDDIYFSVNRFEEDLLTPDNGIYVGKMEGWDYYGNSFDGLPLSVETVGSLSGRTFEVRTVEGDVVMSGVLPEMESLDDIYWTDPIPPIEGDWNVDNEVGHVGMLAKEEPGQGEPPAREPVVAGENDFILWIADEEGSLTEAGVMVYWSYEWSDDPWICPGEPGGDDGHDGGDDDGEVRPDGGYNTPMMGGR